MSINRTKNTTRNIGSGILNKLISIVFQFANRTAILWWLGAQYTGLTGLFSSILEVLSLTELGFNTAIVYSLYRPMAEHDETKIKELLLLFKKIYNIVGFVIFGIGIVILPFIKVFIHGDYPADINLYFLFLIYLINSGVGYFLFAYKECLLIADQRQDISNNIRSVVNIARYLIQFILLWITHDFYLYMFVAILSTIAVNMWINYETKKRYPYVILDDKKIIKMPKELKNQVKGLLFCRIGDVCRNSCDSLIISSFFGLTVTAIYGNYYYILTAIYQVMLIICSAMSASIGNSIIEKSESQNYKDMRIFSAIYSWISGWATVSLICMYQPFMRLWVGNNLLLEVHDMLLFACYFYCLNMCNIRNQYISGTGIWWKLRKSYFYEAIFNLILNIVMGKMWGITGVLLATIITIVFFNYLQRNKVLFKEYFSNQKIEIFYSDQLYYVFLTAIISMITYWICVHIKYTGMLSIVLNAIICVILPNILFVFGLKYTSIYSDIRLLLKRLILVVEGFVKK